MKQDFLYSTQFHEMNDSSLSHCCMHMLCTQGEGSFVYNGRCFHVMKNDLVVLTHPHHAMNLAAHPEMRVEWFAGNYKFMQNQLPSNNYSIGGSITLNSNPVIPLTQAEAERISQDFHRLRDRIPDTHLQFYREMMASLCLTLMYDIFEAHARRDATESHTHLTGYIVKAFMQLLSTGICRTERSLNYYADRLNVSPKYLSATIKRVTGVSVTTHIDQHVIPILKELLDDQQLSLTQIADYMNFTSTSYFTRYCSKHLGVTPSEYRRSLQPKLA